MEIVEELKKPFEWKQFSGKVLPIAGGMLAVHYLGARAEDLVARIGVPAGWVKPASDFTIGLGVLAANAIIVPAEYKQPVRLLAYACFGLGVLNSLKALGVVGFPSYGVKLSPAGKKQPHHSPQPSKFL